MTRRARSAVLLAGEALSGLQSTLIVFGCEARSLARKQVGKRPPMEFLVRGGHQSRMISHLPAVLGREVGQSDMLAGAAGKVHSLLAPPSEIYSLIHCCHLSVARREAWRHSFEVAV